MELRERDLCFIDIETTGSTFGWHEIIEIAALRTSPDASRLMATYSERFRPLHPERLTSSAYQANAFHSAHFNLEFAMSKAEIIKFIAFSKDCIPVCHNPSFERGFLSLSAQSFDLELELDYHWIGTESLAWPLYKSGLIQNLSLADLCEYLGVPPEAKPHHALGGVEACYRVYQALMGSQRLDQRNPF